MSSGSSCATWGVTVVETSEITVRGYVQACPAVNADVVGCHGLNRNQDDKLTLKWSEDAVHVQLTVTDLWHEAPFHEVNSFPAPERATKISSVPKIPLYLCLYRENTKTPPPPSQLPPSRDSPASSTIQQPK